MDNLPGQACIWNEFISDRIKEIIDYINEYERIVDEIIKSFRRQII